MNETKHTPGPWEVCVNDAGQFDVCEEGAGDMICDLAECPKNAEANVCLIAAAPELLAACKAIAALMDGQGRANMPEVAGQARAAIAKATVEAMKKT